MKHVQILFGAQTDQLVYLLKSKMFELYVSIILIAEELHCFKKISRKKNLHFHITFQFYFSFVIGYRLSRWVDRF